MAEQIRVLFLCTGVGIYNRGFETFFRDAHAALHGKMDQIDTMLIKGGGTSTDSERRLWCLPRTGKLSGWIGRIVRRNNYTVEQMSFFPGAVRFIRKWRPDVIYYSDSNIAMQLYKWRQWIGVPFRLLYCNGAPLHPPFILTDHVQQVALPYYEEAIKAGEPPSRHTLVPHGFEVPPDAPERTVEIKLAARRKTGLPLDRPIVLSVGAINRYHKRMHYMVDEVARLPQPRPFLVLLGAFDNETPGIVEQANRMLGENNFICRSVSPHEVKDYYATADVFVLSSLREGFGLVYGEALIQGLPVIYHHHPVMRYVVGDAGYPGDLSKPGELAQMLSAQLASPDSPEQIARRRQSVRDRFSWPVLIPQYADMFRRCMAALPNPLSVGRED